MEKEALEKLRRLIDIDLVALNKTLRDANVPYVAVPQSKAQGATGEAETSEARE